MAGWPEEFNAVADEIYSDFNKEHGTDFRIDVKGCKGAKVPRTGLWSRQLVVQASGLHVSAPTHPRCHPDRGRTAERRDLWKSPSRAPIDPSARTPWVLGRDDSTGRG